MAGSIKSFIYTTARGDNYAIRRDESNTEAVNGNVGDIPDQDIVGIGLPINIRPREAIYTSPDLRRTIRCTVLTEGAFSGIANGNINSIPDPLGTYPQLQLNRLVGERISFYTGLDTGLDDNDAS